MDNDQITKAVQSLAGLTYKQWQVIEQHVNNEFKRLSSKNVFENSERVIKNVVLDLGGS